MKKIILLLILIFGLGLVSINSQDKKRLNERDCIKKSHIDFKKEFIWFVIHGLVEVDGHVFLNDTSECPLIYKAAKDGMKIYNKCTKDEYQYRNCGEKDCLIFHLEDKERLIIEEPSYPRYREFNF